MDTEVDVRDGELSDSESGLSQYDSVEGVTSDEESALALSHHLGMTEISVVETQDLSGVSKEVDPTPLNFLFPSQSGVSDWIFDKVKEILKIVGAECEGYEEQFMAFLTTIKAWHQQHRKNASKKQRELNRLTWSLNTEGSSSRGRLKGKGLTFSP